MNILLTGATGFVGSAIAANLAAKGLLADTRFAVRGDTPADGLARLRSNLRCFELTPGTLNAITESQIVPFDLREAGVAELGDPEVIINYAALTTFSDHLLLWETNVEDMLALGRLTAQGKHPEQFMQIDTAVSCGQLASRHVSESWSVPTLQQHAMPYTYSKGMAELKLHEMVSELPLVMVRPSIMVGHSALGCRPSGSIFWMLRMMAMPETPSYRLSDRADIPLVSDCVEDIVQLTTKPTLAYGLYHVSAGDANSKRIETLYSYFKRCKTSEEDAQALAGYVYREKVVEKALACKSLSLTDDGNVRLIVRCIHLCAKFASMSYVFDNTRLVQGAGSRPRSLLTHLDRCLETSDAVPIPKQMQWDHKQPSDLHGPHGASWRRAITIGALRQNSGHHNKESPMTLQALAHLDIAMLVGSFTSLASVFVLGSLIGFERRVRQRTARLRTNTPVAMAASAFVDMVTQIGTVSDTARMITYVALGVGSLEAGTIMKRRLNVRGLNIAATLWDSVAVGVVTGSDLIGQAILITLSVLALNTLPRLVVGHISRMPLSNQTSEVTYTMYITLTSEHQREILVDLERLFEEASYPISDLSVESSGDDHVEIEAMLMSTAVNVSELDCIVTSLQSQSCMTQASWNLSTTE